MKLKDLRIGNILSSVSQEKETVIVKGIDAVNELVIMDTFSNWNSLDNYEPILITPKWLERLGFEYFANGSGRMYREALSVEVDFLFTKEMILAITLHYSEYHSFLRNIIYVHELQNIFYFVTGEELEF
jgi:hypothetical protein